jgi:hypothetical protein
MNWKRLLIYAITAAVSAVLNAQTGSVPRGGFDLHYRLQGSGKPVVFLAGGPGFDVDYLEDAAKLFPVRYQPAHITPIPTL